MKYITAPLGPHGRALHSLVYMWLFCFFLAKSHKTKGNFDFDFDFCLHDGEKKIDVFIFILDFLSIS